MIQQVFTAYDNKTKAFLPPFQLRTSEEAIRGFTEVCNTQDHQFQKYPEDYSLYLLGEFDDNTGRYENEQEPKLLITGRQITTGKPPKIEKVD